MKRRKFLQGALVAAGMAVLILDSKTGIAGVRAGITLCVYSVIPALFPFLFLSGILTGYLSGRRIRVLDPLRWLFRLPTGSEGIWVAGLLGGYPVGAQSVGQTYRAGCMGSDTARHLILICNNAGPAFLFGMTASLFPEPGAAWLLWGIQITSLLVLSRCMPCSSGAVSGLPQGNLSSSASLKRAISVMGSVCGLMILMRVLLAFLDAWFLWRLPEGLRVTVTGVLELANGVVRLAELPNQGLRFVLCALFLNFGGVCVYLQTMAVTEGIPARSIYIFAKAFQGCIATLLAYGAQRILFPDKWLAPPFLVGLLLLLTLIFGGIVVGKRQKKSSNSCFVGV